MPSVDVLRNMPCFSWQFQADGEGRAACDRIIPTPLLRCVPLGVARGRGSGKRRGAAVVAHSLRAAVAFTAEHGAPLRLGVR